MRGVRRRRASSTSSPATSTAASCSSRSTAGNAAGQPPRRDLGTANTDWEDELTRTAYTQNHNLSFSGGSHDHAVPRVAELLRPAGRRHRQRPAALPGAPQRAARRRSTASCRLGLNLTASRVNNDYLPFENTGGFDGRRLHEHGDLQPDAARSRHGPATSGSVLRDRRRRAVGAQPGRARATRSHDDAPDEPRTSATSPRRTALLPSLTAQINVGVDYVERDAPDVLPARQPGRRLDRAAARARPSATCRT